LAETLGGGAATMALAPLPPRGGGGGGMLFYGHRGASSICPENTEASIRGAFALGADGVEVDIQATKDKQVIVLHDDTLQRTALPWAPGVGEMDCEPYEHLVASPVGSLCFNDVQAVDIGSWKAPEYHAERVVSLKKAFHILREYPGKGILVEVKGGDTSIVPLLREVVEQAQVQPSLVHWIGFDLETMALVKEAFPEFLVFHICQIANCRTPEEASAFIRRARERGLDGVDFPADVNIVSEPLVALAHSLELLVAVWVSKSIPGCDSQDCWTAMSDHGVDIFTSDLPPDAKGLFSPVVSGAPQPQAKSTAAAAPTT